MTDHSRESQYTSIQSGSGGVRSTKRNITNTDCGSSQTSDEHNGPCKHCPENYHPSQVGTGGGQRSILPPLFTVLREASRYFTNYHTEGLYYLLEIPPPVEGSDAEHWLRALLISVIEHFRVSTKYIVRPGDYVGLKLTNPRYIEKPVFVGLRRMDQLDGEVVFDRILAIFDSNKSFFIDGQLEVEFNHIRMPHGSGRIKKALGETNEEFIQGKPSFIKYKNPHLKYPNDENCLPYALIMGRESLNVDKQYYKKYRGSVKLLRAAAVELCSAAGIRVTPGGCSIGDVTKFQAVLPNYQIVIYQSLDPKHVPYTDTDYYQPNNKINILLLNGHYSAMRTLKSCMAAQYVCPDCQTRAVSRHHHKNCVYTCPSCLSRPPCPNLSLKQMIQCDECNRTFRGLECFSNHVKLERQEKFTVCQRIRACVDCSVSYYTDGNDPHICGFAYCVTCEEKRPVGHKCYMTIYKTKKSDEENVLYLVYDFETQQNTLLNPSQPGKRKHVPNACVIRSFCHTCMDEPSIDIHCVACGDKEKIYFSEDCVQDLLYYIIEKGNERKPIAEVDDEGGERPRKRRKRVGDKKFKKIVAIAHNMGGFDGQFILNYILNSDKFPTPKMIINGTRLIHMSLGFNITFLDSLNYFHTSLAALPEMFGFEDSKGYYPHFFNTPENAGKVLKGLPAKKYYAPESMSVEGKKKFDEWYDSMPADYKFDNDEELIKYCIQDVTILRKACMKFAKDFWEVNHIAPFLDACTIAGACNKVFRSNYFYSDTIGILPTNGYRFRDNQSKIAIKWLSLIELTQGIEIQHTGRTLEKRVEGVGKVDGYHEASNTVYEFLGCYFHGCEGCFPNQYQWRWYCYPQNYDDNGNPVYRKDPNPNNEDDERNQTMFQRREQTELRLRLIKEKGYNLVVMKECDFRRCLKQHPEAAKMLNDLPMLNVEPLNPRDAFYGGRTNATKLYFKSDGVTKMYYYDICSLYPYINKTSKCPVSHPEVYIGDICNMIPWECMDGLMKVTVSPPRGLYNPVLPTRMHNKLMFFLCTECAKTLKKCNCGHTVSERAITGTWVIDEVKLALSHGYEIINIHEIWEYKVTQYDRVSKEGGVFVGYINRFLRIKAEASGWPKGCNTDEAKDKYINDFYEREGILLDKKNIKFNPSLRQMAKDQLNSFWGRFGIRPDLIRTIIVKCYDDLVLKMLDPKVDLDSIVPVNDDALLLSFKDKEEHRLPNNTANVVIAAFTTAYARMELYKYLEMLGPERIYYFDTDSIFFTARPGEPMPEVGPFLGQMTDELEKEYGVGSYIIEFVSGGPKNYAFKAYNPTTGKTHTVVKVKGITLNHETSSIVNFDLIKKFVLNAVSREEKINACEPVSDEEEEVEEVETGVGGNVTMRGGMRRRKKNQVKVDLHSIRRTNIGEVYSINVSKTYRVNYTKRRMMPNFDTLPYGY